MFRRAYQKLRCSPQNLNDACLQIGNFCLNECIKQEQP